MDEAGLAPRVDNIGTHGESRGFTVLCPPYTCLKFCMAGCEEKGSNQILASISSSTTSGVVWFAFYFVNGSLLERCRRSKEGKERE